jgi:alkylation response protein AidB-like acyl-CoA dehydrogenase
MDFDEPEDIVAMRDTIRKFVAREFKPADVRRWDKEALISRDVSLKFGELGICGLCIPEEYGGLGRNVIAMGVVLEELSRVSNALPGLYNMSAGYGGLTVSEAGTAEQKKRLLPGLVRGETLFAYGLSEPDIGADLAYVKTRAERRSDKVVINGAKRWISGALIADYVYTLVRSGAPEATRRNLSFIAVPTNAKGVTITGIGTMGAHGISTCDVLYDNVELPFDDCVMGGEKGWNNGWNMLAGPSLEIEKIQPTFIALGIAEAAMQEAWDYSQQRVQGGKKICGHQAVRHVLVDCQTRLHGMRLMLRHAAWLVENKKPSAVYTSMCKQFVSDTARDIVINLQQNVMGAYGYAEGFNMERLVRDVLIFPIAGGSTAIQRNNIANLMKLPRE